MLARRFRLTKQDNVEGLLLRGQFLMGRYFALRWRKNAFTRHRFSMIVSLKVSSNAVRGHRIRRQLQEIARCNYERIPYPPHFDILILPKKSIIDAPYQEIEKQFLSLIKKIQ